MTLNHAADLLYGIGLLGLVGYQIYTGIGIGRIGRFAREENPGYFWFLVVVEIIFALVCLGRLRAP